ncbi:hypothetical protein SAMD00019534_051020 [Acytostelium subglobosum LB1]|uniref:hypothetical protein n=1 Tax=Acytostelium subglobosum LB1 TaxID=1410327 RepID=UPI000644DB9A|nr:hypothetical protein SAMD00019534_051020 [Acytostelium subglobosum LB1]GAM21927.1 hypothetical protein SAMD00019534_051020 [Acytostelium subglobosum LB1]|eukprot:XP_012755027.1 hypothetical protein SAMD00019534_051020 [Acytostelium subglobosum LB1]
MSSFFNFARRTLFTPSTRQFLRGGDHGHGHGGPEYGIPNGLQKNISFATKIVACAIMSYIPFAAINHQKAKKASKD